MLFMGNSWYLNMVGKHLLYILDILLFVHCVFFNVETFYQVLTDLVHMNLCFKKQRSFCSWSIHQKNPER